MLLIRLAHLSHRLLPLSLFYQLRLLSQLNQSVLLHQLLGQSHLQDQLLQLHQRLLRRSRLLHQQDQ